LIISKRFDNFLPGLIDEDPTGFIKRQKTHDNIRRTLHVIENVKENHECAVILSLDAEKAFASVNWAFLYQVLERFGFNEKYSSRV